MKFILVSPKNRPTYNFRGDLIKEIKACGYEVIVTGPNDDNLDKIEELGVNFIKIPLEKNGLNPLSDIKYMLRLKKLFKEEKPDVILTYTIKPVIYGSVAAKMAKVPNINCLIAGAGYTFISQTFKAKILRAIVKFLYKTAFCCANTVIFQNEDDAQEFTRMKLLKKEKCGQVNGSGVNMNKFTPAPLPENVSFLMVSRVMYNKGVREYLRAAEIVKEKYPKARFMLLGAVENIQDSLKWEEINPYIEKQIIEYFGETAEIEKFYEQCSVYVLPSYREGTPRTVLEAMAMGRCVLTTDAPGCRGTVEDGKTGFIVPPKNAEALSEKMIWFIENKARIAEMGEAGTELCRRKFDVSKVNAAMLEYMHIC